MTTIEWTERTWNPVVGCTPVSPGCLNCYAARVALRMRGMGKRGYTDDSPALTVEGRPIAEMRGGRAVFTGSVRCVEEALTEPLRRKKPTMWFVNSMSDLFHEGIPFEVIDRVFAVMNACSLRLPISKNTNADGWHTFQVLTKRPERMAEYIESRNPRRFGTGEHPIFKARGVLRGCGAEVMNAGGVVAWPLENVWLGASVEDRPRADERVPIVTRLSAAGWLTFLSCEPLLGAVDLHAAWYRPRRGPEDDYRRPHSAPIGWVIVGAESGPKARPCNVEWIRSIVRQCRAAKVPVFVKQLGARPVAQEGVDYRRALTINGITAEDNALGQDVYTIVGSKATVTMSVDRVFIDAETGRMSLRDSKGGDMAEWPEDLRVREMPR